MSTENIQSDKDAYKAGVTEAELWLRKIERAKDDERDWRKEAQEAVLAYEANGEDVISFNIFHSNVETLIPALYNSSPVPDVRRRFGDADMIGKQVVDLSERAIVYSIDQFDIDGEFTGVIRDAAIAGRGVLRGRYTPYMDGDNVGNQETTCERWPWDKFICGPGRSWRKIPWIAFELDLTKDELAKLNPGMSAKLDIGEKSDSTSNSGNTKDPTGILKTTRIFEIWDRTSKHVLFIDDQKRTWKKSPPLSVTDITAHWNATPRRSSVPNSTPRLHRNCAASPTKGRRWRWHCSKR